MNVAAKHEDPIGSYTMQDRMRNRTIHRYVINPANC